MRKKTMNHKLTNLTNNELVSIFGGEDCMCCCMNISKFLTGANLLMKAVESTTECDKLCKNHEIHTCYPKNQPDDTLLRSTPITPTLVYDRISSAREYSITK